MDSIYLTADKCGTNTNFIHCSSGERLYYGVGVHGKSFRAHALLVAITVSAKKRQ